MKKILKFLFGVKITRHKLRLELRTAVSTKINEIRSFIPDDFQRLPRTVDLVGLYKATESRLFLLYVGPVLLLQILDGSQKNRDIYLHFLVLHVSSVMLTRDATEQQINYCDRLLRNFVLNFARLYGRHYVSQNIHSLIHLCNDVRIFGKLDDYSAFMFENENRLTKNLLKQSPEPLKQLVKRNQEIRANFPVVRSREFEFELFSKLHENGPLIFRTVGPQFSSVEFKKFKLKIKKPNNIFLTVENEVYVLINIAHCSNTGTRILIAQKFLELRDLYTEPRHSSSLNIYSASRLSPLQTVQIRNVRAKCMALPLDGNSFAIFPLSHCFW
jgi:hypothetical protein